MKAMKEEIEQLKKEKNAVILAHYYVPKEVQEIAVYRRSLFKIKKQKKNREDKISSFSGVSL